MSRARLHEKDLSKVGRVGQAEGCLRKSCPSRGDKRSPEEGGWARASEGKLPLKS